MSSRRQKLLARVNWFLQSSLKHTAEYITGKNFYQRAGRYRQVEQYILSFKHTAIWMSWCQSWCHCRHHVGIDCIKLTVLASGFKTTFSPCSRSGLWCHLAKRIMLDRELPLGSTIFMNYVIQHFERVRCYISNLSWNPNLEFEYIGSDYPHALNVAC